MKKWAIIFTCWDNTEWRAKVTTYVKSESKPTREQARSAILDALPKRALSFDFNTIKEVKK